MLRHHQQSSSQSTLPRAKTKFLLPRQLSGLFHGFVLMILKDNVLSVGSLGGPNFLFLGGDAIVGVNIFAIKSQVHEEASNTIYCDVFGEDGFENPEKKRMGVIEAGDFGEAL